MGDKTAISWCTHTFNAWWGCQHAAADAPEDRPTDRPAPTSSECTNCYAEALDHRTTGNAHWGPGASRRFFGDDYWAKPRRWNAAAEKAGVRARVFCSSMADVFEWRDGDVGLRMEIERVRLWRLINETPWLDWLLLTKRPENLETMLPWATPSNNSNPFGKPWPNVWLGVTAGVERSMWRVDILRRTPAAVRFISCEPLLEHIRAETWDRVLRRNNVSHAHPDGFTAIDWLIVGDESGSGRRPAQLDWVRTAREAAQRHRVAFHFKQWNGLLPGTDNHKNNKIHLPVLDGRQHAAFPRVT